MAICVLRFKRSQGIYLNTVAGTNFKENMSPYKYATGELTFESNKDGINKLILNHLLNNPLGTYGILPMDFPFYHKSTGVVNSLIFANHPHFK